jgi:monofunctional biosynthetic peptidoglycan transglycosylase
MMNKETFNRSLNETFWYAKRTIQILFLVSLIVTVLYRRINPPITPLMVIRFFDQVVDGRDITFDKHRVDIKKVSPNVIYAIVAGEDNNFVSHAGFDFDALYKALEYNLKHKTITL